MDDKKKVLHDYYKAKLRLEILTAEVKEKQEAVMTYLSEQPGGKAEIDHAKFTVRKTPVYEFSEQVKKAEDFAKESSKLIKDQKDLEIKNGIAKVISESVTVMMIKL